MKSQKPFDEKQLLPPPEILQKAQELQEEYTEGSGFEGMVMAFLDMLIPDNETWDSDSSKMVCESFKEIEKDFMKAKDQFDTYNTFLENTLESYLIEENKLSETIDNGVSNLDVNEG